MEYIYVAVGAIVSLIGTFLFGRFNRTKADAKEIGKLENDIHEKDRVVEALKQDVKTAGIPTPTLDDLSVWKGPSGPSPS